MNLQFTYLNPPSSSSDVDDYLPRREYFQTRNSVPNFSEIIPGLYVGNEHSGRNSGNQFDLVVNCTPEVPFHRECKKTIRIPVGDDPIEVTNMYKYIADTRVLEQMHQNIQNYQSVLVHCHQGISRSCTIVACYLIKYQNMSPAQAIHFIKMKRNIAFQHGVNFRPILTLVYKQKI
jgi:Dual specificity phosphatase, catalytic domain